ncbi:hypothetical protein NHX12_027851 [Muraenolepis orangiensis]|uniref:Uncharacterized protein n=1 Tax=Muraenolepis orangiensis TaxID=630683 RepID=A0A9Q0EJS9_9TELE|nr:hypothetical protein NHX12_027851 [Muraenolepis orangiensis]
MMIFPPSVESPTLGGKIQSLRQVAQEQQGRLGGGDMGGAGVGDMGGGGDKGGGGRDKGGGGGGGGGGELGVGGDMDVVGGDMDVVGGGDIGGGGVTWVGVVVVRTCEVVTWVVWVMGTWVGEGRSSGRRPRSSGPSGPHRGRPAGRRPGEGPPPGG